MNVLVVGSVALDSVETPQASAWTSSADRRRSLRHRLDLAPVRLVAVVGQDFPRSTSISSALRIDVTGLQRVDGRTFRWSGRYLPDLVRRETSTRS